MNLIKNNILNFGMLIAISLFCSCATSRNIKTNVSTNQQLTESQTEPALYNPSATKYFDLIHTKLDVAFDWTNSRMPGSAEISLRSHFYPSNKLHLNARGMDINEVKLIKGEIKTDLEYQYRNDSISITLDKIYTSLDTVKIYIDYISKPEELVTEGSAAITNDKGLYFINADQSDPEKPRQIWTQGETQAASAWFPTIDRPNQKSTQEIYITVDTSFVTLSNGKKISSIVNNTNGTRTDYWKQNLPHSPYLFMMAVGNYKIVKDEWRKKEVSYYVEPEYEKYARRTFGNTPEMLEFFSELLGMEYPWDKYSQVVVRDYVSGAMENTTATIFGEFMNQDDRQILDQSYEDVISHELFHHWFGDLVTTESWSNLPLNESFATYGEYLWNEYKYGRNEADYYGQNDLNNYLREARSKQVDLIRYDYKKRDDMFDSHSYAKGGRVLHMLRKYTGDEAFFTSLKLYLEASKFKNAEIHNLRLAFEEVTGEDLNWFFNEWFLDKGHPSLKIEYAYDAENKKQLVTVEQMQNLETTPLYKLPVSMDIYSKTDVKRHQINVTKKVETFKFDVNEKPLLVNFDAEKMLLCTKIDNHSDEDWIVMYNRGKLYLDRYEALSKLVKNYSAVTETGKTIKKALDDPHWNIRELAIKNSAVLIKSEPEIMKQKILTIAKQDPKSSVRNEALLILSELYADDIDVKTFMKNAINDSSYLVMSSAIGYIVENNKEEGFSILKKLEDDKNSNILFMVSDYYSSFGGDAQYEFMTRTINNSYGASKYAAMLEYGKFLMRCSPGKTKKALELVAEVGTSDPVWFVRFSAAQVLNDISKSYGKNSESSGDNKISSPEALIESENEAVRNKAAILFLEIKSLEKDPKLIKIYNPD